MENTDIRFKNVAVDTEVSMPIQIPSGKWIQYIDFFFAAGPGGADEYVAFSFCDRKVDSINKNIGGVVKAQGYTLRISTNGAELVPSMYTLKLGNFKVRPKKEDPNYYACVKQNTGGAIDITATVYYTDKPIEEVI